MIVPFATICDQCPRRSPEYTSFPTCFDCGDHICSDHESTSLDKKTRKSFCNTCAQFDCPKCNHLWMAHVDGECGHYELDGSICGCEEAQQPTESN